MWAHFPASECACEPWTHEHGFPCAAVGQHQVHWMASPYVRVGFAGAASKITRPSFSVREGRVAGISRVRGPEVRHRLARSGPECRTFGPLSFGHANPALTDRATGCRAFGPGE